MTLRCDACDSTQRRPTIAAYAVFRELPGVAVLSDAASQCARCGTVTAAIRDREQLIARLAELLIRKRDRLNADELTFLREHVLEWPAATFARRLGANTGNAWKWEAGHKPIPEVSDKLLRLIIARKLVISDFSIELLDAIAHHEGPPLSLTAHLEGQTWVIHLRPDPRPPASAPPPHTEASADRRRPTSPPKATTAEVHDLLAPALARAGSWAALSALLHTSIATLQGSLSGQRHPHRRTIDRWRDTIARATAAG